MYFFFGVFSPALQNNTFLSLVTLPSSQIHVPHTLCRPCLLLLGAQGMEKLLGLKEGSPEARELRMCTSFANSGPLPLLFVDSIFGAHPGEL